MRTRDIDRFRLGTTPGLRCKGRARFSTPWSVKVWGRYLLTVYRWGAEVHFPGAYLVYSWRTGEGVQRVFLSSDGTPDSAVSISGRRLLVSWRLRGQESLEVAEAKLGEGER